MPDQRLGAVIPIKDEDYGEVARLKHAVHGFVGRVYVIDDTKDAPSTQPYTAPPQRSAQFYTPGAGSLGRSILVGLISARWDKRVVLIDAGGSHNPGMVPSLLAVDADVVIGSRFVPGGIHEGPWWRSVGSRVAAHAFNLRYRTHIRDWTSGYRVYSDKAVATILRADPQCKRHAIQAEMLGICVEAGLTVREVPIRYTVGSGSTFSRKAVAEIIHLWLTSWR